MTNVTQVLSQIESGDPSATEQLLPLVYDELRRLASSKLSHERSGQTLQPTALVHEAFLRLVEGATSRQWDSRGHFFAAAAEAMRRILVDTARHKASLRHGGGKKRHDLLEDDLVAYPISDELLDLDAALSKFAAVDPQAAQLVKLRVFAGMTIAEIAEFQGISLRSAKRNWAYARAWLGREFDDLAGGDQ